jgi:hypothetical protein
LKVLTFSDSSLHLTRTCMHFVQLFIFIALNHLLYCFSA